MKTKRSIKYNCQEMLYDINCFHNETLTFRDIFDQIDNLFEQLYQEFILDLKDSDKVRVVFHHDQIDFPISIPFVLKHALSTELLMNEFEKVFQSHKTIAFNQNHPLKPSIIVMQLPTGSGNDGKFSSVQNTCNEISGVKTIKNSDNLCVANC